MNTLTWHKIIFPGYILLPPQLLAEVEARLHPLHAEIQPECDGVVLVIDAEDIRNLETCQDSHSNFSNTSVTK
jgi:hypothetical protein